MAERCFACDRTLAAGGRFEVDTRDDQIVWVGSDCYRRVVAAGEDGWQPPKGGPRLYPVVPTRMSLGDFETALDAVVRASWNAGREESDAGCPDEYAAVYNAYKRLLSAVPQETDHE